MENSWIAGFLIALVVLAVWRSQPSGLFVVRIRHGIPVATHGKVTEAFLLVIAELCQEQGILSGEVRGLRRGCRISLGFSKELPNGFCQRLRNWWALSGWSARPNRA